MSFASDSFPSIWIREIGGTSGHDGTAHAANTQANGSGTTRTSGNLTPTVQPGLISAVMYNDSSSAGAADTGNGFTASSPSGGWNFGGGSNFAWGEQKRYTSTSALAATFTGVNNTDSTVVMAALYKESATALAPFIPNDTQPQTFRRVIASDFSPPNLLTQQTLKLPPFTQRELPGWKPKPGIFTDFAPPNLLTQGTLKLPPFTQENDGARTFWRGVYTDFAPPNLLTQGTLKLPPFTQENDGAQSFYRGVYTDFQPPNLLADRLLPAPPVASVDLSQQVKYRWVPSFDPPNLTLGLPKPPIIPTEWTLRIEAKGVYTDFAPPNLILNTLAPLPPPPIAPQDLSGIRLDTRWLGDFFPPNLLTGILPTPPPTTTKPAGRHGSRAEAEARYRRDNLRARMEALKEQRRAAEEALEHYESREVRERTKVLKRIRVKSGATYPALIPLKKPLEQYAPVKRAIAQRNESLGRYRAILRAFEQTQTQLRELEAQLRDDEAAVALMQFLMWEADWRE